MDTKKFITTHRQSLIFTVIAIAIVAIVYVCTLVRGTAKVDEVVEVKVDSAMLSRIDTIMSDTIGDRLGLYVYDLTAGMEMYSYRSDALMSTASNMKLLTILTVINQLGTDYTFSDSLTYNGEIKEGILYGDVCMKFGFDPVFNEDSISGWAKRIRQAGIDRVKGNILVDMPITEKVPLEAHWEKNDFHYYVASPIFRGENDMLSLVDKTLLRSGLYYDRKTVQLGKALPTNKVLQVTTSSIEVSLFNIFQHSSNVDAESLLYSLGCDSLMTSGYRSSGIAKMKSFIINEIQQNPDSVAVIHDGCGLCPQDKMSAYFIVQLLKYAYNHKDIYNYLQKNLPISGKTGTLIWRMGHTPAEGRIHAKTGRLTRNGGVSSLSGYAMAKNGHVIAFSCLSNGIEVEGAKAWEDRLCQLLVE